MPIGTYDPGTDRFDLKVNYGGLRYETFFGPAPSIPLPRTPPPSASGPGKCRCPACASEGWYAESPFCKYWGDNCDLCAGTRFWISYDERRFARRLPCDLCPDRWRRDVAWFRFALRSPRAAARKLRDDVARAAAAQREEVSR